MRRKYGGSRGIELLAYFYTGCNVRKHAGSYLSFLTVCILAFSPKLPGQNYLYGVGKPTFTVAESVEDGYINFAMGNLHKEIRLGSFPQRGGVEFSAALIYDSRIWRPVNGQWQPTNVAGTYGGWRFPTTVDAGNVNSTTTTAGCGTQHQNFVWTQPDGTQRFFPITTCGAGGTGTPNGDAYATDSSGFHMYITNYTSATIFSRSGIKVYPFTEDSNGNYFSSNANGDVIDTLGRVPVTKTINGNQIYYDVLNSQGSTSRYTVTTTTVNVNTAFNQSGISENAGSFTVFSSISFPDGTSYNFSYDSGSTGVHYGTLTGVTLRSGGTVTYGYTNFSDSYGNINRWVTSRVFAGGTWTFTPQVITTCSPGGTGCQQSLTRSLPSGDQKVFTFTLNNGAWITQTQTYNGSASSGSLLASVTTDYDFSNPCTLAGCTGNMYIRPIRYTTTHPVPGTSIVKKTEFTYDNTYYGNITAQKDWLYYAGTAPANPDRQINYTYFD